MQNIEENFAQIHLADILFYLPWAGMQWDMSSLDPMDQRVNFQPRVSVIEAKPDMNYVHAN